MLTTHVGIFYQLYVLRLDCSCLLFEVRWWCSFLVSRYVTSSLLIVPYSRTCSSVCNQLVLFGHLVNT